MERRFVTKHALTHGILEVCGNVIGPGAFSVPFPPWNECYYKPDWHERSEAAFARARTMKAAELRRMRKRLAALEDEIMALEDMRFHSTVVD